MKKKNTLVTRSCVLSDASNSKSEVSKSNSWKVTSFSKTTSLQRELFLTMFCTINLSPLLVIKKGIMMIIILSNYQLCPLPLTMVHIRTCSKLLLLWVQYSGCYGYSTMYKVRAHFISCDTFQTNHKAEYLEWSK